MGIFARRAYSGRNVLQDFDLGRDGIFSVRFVFERAPDAFWGVYVESTGFAKDAELGGNPQGGGRRAENGERRRRQPGLGGRGTQDEGPSPVKKSTNGRSNPHKMADVEGLSSCRN